MRQNTKNPLFITLQYILQVSEELPMILRKENTSVPYKPIRYLSQISTKLRIKEAETKQRESYTNYRVNNVNLSKIF